MSLSSATEINQSTLAPAIAARSAKVFYYLQQSGYETMKFIHANYSIISRMEAVHVRDASLPL